MTSSSPLRPTRTKENDTVLDLFMRSGTTLFVAKRMRRHSIGIDIVPEYHDMVRRRLQPVEFCFFGPEDTETNNAL
ncbi:MAG: site-specific DNA-methyltransferase [Azoarcus sp.]|nr:site-specific DNA-methyltransferase [Azoarcus sp.]